MSVESEHIDRIANYLVESQTVKISQDCVKSILTKALEFFSENSRDDHESLICSLQDTLELKPKQFRQSLTRIEKVIQGDKRFLTTAEKSNLIGAIRAARGKVMRGGVHLLEHPDVKAFRREVLESYIPHGDARIGLLVPCAKIKPFRHSRTHKAVDDVVKRVTHQLGLSSNAVDVLVISEPIGIIPRNWELRYPAMNYDMALGAWLPIDKVNKMNLKGEERAKTFSRIAEVSKTKKGSKRYIVKYLSDVVGEFLDEVGPHYRKSIGYVRSSHKEILEKALSSKESTLDIIPTSQDVRRIIKERGRLHWAFQGLRGKPALEILEKKLKYELTDLM